VLFLDARSLDVEHVPCPLEEAGLSLLVVDTRTPHRLVDGEYADRRRSCEQAAAALGIGSLRDSTLDQAQSLEDDRLRRRARHVISENARVLEVVGLLREGRIAETGPQLTASHNSLRDDYEVSSPEQDVAVDTLLSAGALGARMTGAGFGGCVLALVEASATDAITEKVMRAFAEKAFNHPVTFVTSPAPGAGRLR
ncbi:MAG: galactokinase, partial [Actinomycetota bacterium]|nr:galactokinase [Actinomycetota bacterium]